MQNTAFQDIAVLIAAVFGGADILAFVICKYCKRLKSTHVVFLIDAIVISCGLFVINDTILSLLGILSAFVCSMMIDKAFLGSSTAYVAHIITDNSNNISQSIIVHLDKTATIVDVIGAYSKETKKMVIVSFSLREYRKLMSIINDADPKAFIQVFRSHEINGEGWTKG